MEVLRQIHFQALEPPMIEALIELIDRDLGYHLYASIEQSKCALSETSSTRFWFSEGTLNIEELLSQDQFEAWIQPQIEQINSSISPAPTSMQRPSKRYQRSLHDGRNLVRADRGIYLSGRRARTFCIGACMSAKNVN